MTDDERRLAFDLAMKGAKFACGEVVPDCEIPMGAFMFTDQEPQGAPIPLSVAPTKEIGFAALRQMCKSTDAYAVITVSEAWLVEGTEETAEEDLRIEPRLNPKRIEVAFIAWEYRREMGTSSATIETVDGTRKLGEWRDVVVEGDGVTLDGKMTRLLAGARGN